MDSVKIDLFKVTNFPLEKTRKYSNLYKINITEILNTIQIDISKVTNCNLESNKLLSANITNKEEIKEQDFDKNFFFKRF